MGLYTCINSGGRGFEPRRRQNLLTIEKRKGKEASEMKRKKCVRTEDDRTIRDEKKSGLENRRNLITLSVERRNRVGIASRLLLRLVITNNNNNEKEGEAKTLIELSVSSVAI